MIYIATTDLLKVAQEEVRRIIAWYLNERA